MKTSSSAAISRSKAQRTPCNQGRGEKKRGAHVGFETGTPEKEMPPSAVPCAAPVTPPARAAVPLTLRKSMEEMSAELQQLLERPFPGTSLFYVLDKIARLSPLDSDGVILDQLVENCAIAAEKSSPRLVTRLAKATAGGHLRGAGGRRRGVLPAHAGRPAVRGRGNEGSAQALEGEPANAAGTGLRHRRSGGVSRGDQPG